MNNNIFDILKELKLEDTGRYENHFYILDLEDSNEYARVYTKLCDNAINTEFPNFETNTSKNTTKITNYFEFELNNLTHNLFLIADFDEDKYYLKIGEK